jgi:aminopeptidase N
MKPVFLLLTLFALSASPALAQLLQDKKGFTRQDSLRGSNGPERSWWDVLHYAIAVAPDYQRQLIRGRTTIRYRVLPNQRSDYMQIDLQEPLTIDTIFYNGKRYIDHPARPPFREGNVWHIPLPRAQAGSVQELTLAYSGKPRVAQRPPWDGGWVFTRDKKGNPWMSVACQGLGASAWYPCKDFQGDEPDEGASLTMEVPTGLTGVSNGRLVSRTETGTGSRFTWEVKSPINNYNIIPYIGKYVNWNDTLQGEKGALDLSYWVLEEDLDRAKAQFQQVKPVLRGFEHWFGPYPFYEDGFKLVQAPYLGMEHQSAVAYGNGFGNGYLGQDLSGSGWGLKWDYIIVHEVGHEWFGNNITTRDIADMWVHEGFTSYSEALYTDYLFGTTAGNEYARGLRKNIENDRPVIGPYGVNQEGSGDMYSKGASLVHTIRQVVNNDSLFRQLLRGLNKTFYRQTVTSRQVEAFLSAGTGKDLGRVFDQYLRTAKIPVLEIRGGSYRWTNVVPGFDMPVRLTNGKWLYPTTQPQPLSAAGVKADAISVDPNFYIEVKKN